MKAVVYRDFGPGALRLEDIPRPVPRDDEVLVEVRAAGVNLLDWYLLGGIPVVSRLLRGSTMKRMGVDLAGRVEAVGRNVTRFRPGDEIFGSARGSFAEFVCTPERAVALRPKKVSFVEAAAVPVAGVTALQGLRNHARVQPGQKALINGASGGIGTFAVQIARTLGAEVTAVCSTRNVDRMREIGAQHVIDYTREDFTAGAARYDVILDIVGNHPLAAFRRILTPSGVYVAAGGPPLRNSSLFLVSPFIRNLVVYVTRRNAADLELLRDWIETGRVKPVIDRIYRLDQTSEAVAYVARGHTQGKVVISIDDRAA